jgi:hypothetical protein
MFVENWVAAILFAIFMIIALVPSLGWFVESMRLEKAEKQNKRLISETITYKSEIRRLNAKISILELIKSEEDK